MTLSATCRRERRGADSARRALPAWVLVRNACRPCENSDTEPANATLERPQVTLRSIIIYSALVATHSCFTAERR